jgi:hypothetical protein
VPYSFCRLTPLYGTRSVPTTLHWHRECAYYILWGDVIYFVKRGNQWRRYSPIRHTECAYYIKMVHGVCLLRGPIPLFLVLTTLKRHTECAYYIRNELPTLRSCIRRSYHRGKTSALVSTGCDIFHHLSRRRFTSARGRRTLAAAPRRLAAAARHRAGRSAINGPAHRTVRPAAIGIPQ